MAQLIISAAGAVVGSFIPGVGPMLGWAIGSMLGGAVIKQPNQQIQGNQQKLMDLRITGVEYGQPIPFVIGAAGIAGQMWWNTDRRPTTITTTTHTDGGGKGGGGGGTDVSSSIITYDMDCLIGLSDNEIAGVARVWSNGALIWTDDSYATPESRAASLEALEWTRMTVYTGSETQFPDPTYEAAVGISSAPAYRGRGYVFIEGLKLGQSGQVPNLTFEIVRHGHTVTVDTVYANLDRSKTVYPYSTQITEPPLKYSNDVPVGTATMQWSASVGNLFKAVGDGKAYYAEFTLYGNECGFGIVNDAFVPLAGLMLGADVNSYGIAPGWGGGYFLGVTAYHDGVGTPIEANAGSYGWGKWGMLFDTVAGTISMWQDGVSKGIVFSGLSGNFAPAAQIFHRLGGAQVIVNFGQLPWTGGGPYGGLPWIVSSSRAGLEKTSPTLAEAVSLLCVRAGLAPAQFDVSALASITRPVNSMTVSQIAATRTAIELLMTAFYFEMVVSDKIYFRPRGRDSVAVIPYGELAASRSEDQPEPLALSQASDLEIPSRIALTYTNIADDYQTDTQYSDRLISADPNTTSAVTLTLGLTPSEAKAIADTMLADQAASVVNTTINVLGDYCALEPTDAVTVEGPDGEVFRVRLVKKTDSYPVLSFDAVVDVVSVLVAPGVTSEEYISSNEVLFPAVTLMELLDVPILSEADDNAGFYVAAKGDTGAWPGAAIFSSADGTEYVRKATISLPAVFGVCTTTLGPWGGGRVFDEQNSVTVDVGLGKLASSTRDSLLNSQAVNAMFIGAEFIQYRTATLIATGVYKLTGLLRGGRGTEWAEAGHVASERCVSLSVAGMTRIVLGNADLGLSRFYKGVTLGAGLSSATAEEFVDSAVGLKPFSPVNARVARDVANNVAVTWQRRTRLPVRMIGTLGISVPLAEESEKYEIDFYADNTFAAVVRTASTTGPAVDYSAVDQTANGLTPGAPIYARIYQMSAAIGRGYPLEYTA